MSECMCLRFPMKSVQLLLWIVDDDLYAMLTLPLVVLQAATDVWSLGCMLYAMCYYQTPFELVAGATGSLALAIAQGKVNFPSNDDPYTDEVRALIGSLLFFSLNLSKFFILPAPPHLLSTSSYDVFNFISSHNLLLLASNSTALQSALSSDNDRERTDICVPSQPTAQANSRPIIHSSCFRCSS